jgi:Fe-S-cluster-containing dehydrogenase component
MSARFPTLDPSRCTGCGACEVACVERRYDLVDLRPDDAIVLERRRLAIRAVAGVPTLDVCVHCAESPCVAVCPHYALLRYPDGRVDLLEDRCTGCGHCIAACTFRAIRRVTALDIAVKCDGCRTLAGGPACAPACPTDALTMSGPKIDAPGQDR